MLTMRHLLLLGVAALACAVVPAAAETRLGTPFTDHMMVQADRPIPVWGWDAAGTNVTVRLGTSDGRATADAAGYWRVDLAPLPAGDAALTLAVNGTDALAVADVIAGDVYWCSGQSNMSFAVDKSDSAADVLAAPADPRLRLLQLPRQSLDEPTTTADADWRIAGPETLGDFSAVAYHFGQTLRRETGRPVGLVHGSWGGSKLRAWLPAEALAASPLGGRVLADAAADLASFEQRLADWRQGDRQGRQPYPNGGGPQHRPSRLHNGMTHPLGPILVRGVIWYQGEGDVATPEQYAELFPRLVRSWRDQFEAPDLPVFVVQLPGFDKQPAAGRWPAFREMQRRLAADAGIDLAVTIDLGDPDDPDDVHPTNKKPVGERLASLALRRIYDRPAPASPAPTRAVADGDALIVSFADVGDGLKLTRGAAVTGFELVDSAGVAKAVEGEIVGKDQVRLPGGADAREVRYAQAGDPAVNLVNSAGLPATPFVLPIE